MAQQTDKPAGVLRSLDWWTIAIYVALLAFGWVSVCGASYTYGDTDIFSLESRSGMQIVWIGTSLALGLFLLLLDDRFYDTFAYVIYGLLVLLLIGTIFNPHEIKGSRSWLVLGPLRLQPAEFAKFATALAVAKLMSTYGFTMDKWKHFAAAIAVVVLPMICIVLQKETGSALVYLSFFLMFYREGMTGSILFTGVAMVFYFVVGVRFEETMLWDTPTSVGKFVVLLAVQTFTAFMVRFYCRDKRQFWLILAYTYGLTLLALLFSKFVIPFDIVWVQMALTAILVGLLVFEGLGSRLRTYYYIALFAVGSVIFFNAADYVLNNIMEPHQRTRINVPDFIFCTVGEEEGFLGCATVLLLFLALILRLIKMAERQPFRFGRVYGYCVLSVFLFHLFINVGMVLGLTPVIGIPLPFFSYGGSSLWGFTLLLFIFLRIDASRNMVRQ